VATPRRDTRPEPTKVPMEIMRSFFLSKVLSEGIAVTGCAAVSFITLNSYSRYKGYSKYGSHLVNRAILTVFSRMSLL
jgi:hypothetical protein